MKVEHIIIDLDTKEIQTAGYLGAVTWPHNFVHIALGDLAEGERLVLRGSNQLILRPKVSNEVAVDVLDPYKREDT